MALVRVYCGLAASEPPTQPGVDSTSLLVALVDDAGRVLDMSDIPDQPQGYANLSSMLAERASGPYSVAIATNAGQGLVPRLLTTAGWALAFADSGATDDYAERFADELIGEGASGPLSRRALGLARALQAGTLAATTHPAPPELVELKPVLAADGALATGRYGAAVALREVLRELYPAALRAYPDPADPVALAVMDALPEPGTLAGSSSGRGRDAAAAADAVTAQLVAQGLADPATIAEAITALRVAIAETPRRAGISRALAATIAETVRQSVAAVRACDAARAALINTLAERAWSTPATASGGAPLPTPAAAPAGMPSPSPAAFPPQPPAPPSPAAYPQPAAAAHPDPVAAVPRPAAAAPAPAPVLGPANQPTSGGARPVSAPPPPPGITPLTEPRSTLPAQRPPGDREARPVSAGGPAYAPGSGQPYPVPDPSPAYLPRAAGANPHPRHDAEVRVPTPRPTAEGPPPGSRADWPTSPPDDEWAREAPGSPPATQPPASPGPVTPPWLADDLKPPEPPQSPPDPPALRLVEPTLPAELREDLGYPAWSEPPPLRLVDPDEGIPRSAPPVGTDEGDGDLLIFAQARSAWFTDHDGDTPWSSPLDAGWRAAEQAAHPTVGDETTAGLPRRVPHANLIPGAPPDDRDRPLRVVRDPASIAAHTSGFFDGWRRGQEVGGYPLGTRTNRPAAGAWDFARDDRMSG